MSEFVTDLTKIQERVRRHMEEGTMTAKYKGDLKAQIKVLNSEIIARTDVVVIFTASFRRNQPLRDTSLGGFGTVRHKP